MSELSDVEEARPENYVKEQAEPLLQTETDSHENGGTTHQNGELFPSESGEEDQKIPVDKRDLMKKNITLMRGIAIVLNAFIGTGRVVQFLEIICNFHQKALTYE